jgi:predicted SAM-dependent methyltransferase
VNLGCGARFHPDWTNIDLVAQAPFVIAHDLRNGIPLPDESCDVVYHAAVLEHIRVPDVGPFMRECCRVLKPAGVIRIGVPDLERLCRLYLQKLELAAADDEASAADYDWIMIEMYDQVTREHGGGAMLDYLARDFLPNEQFIYDRIGEEGRELVRSLRADRGRSSQPVSVMRKLVRRGRSMLGALRRSLLIAIGGPDAVRAIQIGRFRLSGEAHQWMYDRYSLRRLLLASGFRDTCVRPAWESIIPEWSKFELDARSDRTPIKPDLFFMEAVKPSP